MASTITDNTEEKQFELSAEGKMARVEFILNAKGVIYLTHTEVPPALEGQGIASKMVEQVLTNVEERGLKLAPLCPFVAAYIRRNPEWKKLLAENFNVE